MGVNDLIRNGPEVKDSKIESSFEFWTKKITKKRNLAR